MTRVATYGNYQSALLDLMAAQGRSAEAQKRVATQKNATDLVGFGRQSEVLTALKGSQSRLQGYIDASQAVSARLTTQDLALTQVNDGVDRLRQAVETVLSTDTATGFMLELEAGFQGVRGGLNMKHQGAYLFAGASTSTLPLTAETLADVAAAPTVGDLFQNDGLKTASRVAEGTTLETGMLADELGTEVLTILRDIQAYHAGPNGPLSGRATEAQKAFLTTQLGRLKQAGSNMIDQIAHTGSMAAQIEATVDTQTKQQDALQTLVAERTDADMAEAYTQLEFSKVAIEASARVIAGLRDVSLLNFLR